MPYVDSLLATDERIVRRERQHWLWPLEEGVRGAWILVAGIVLFAVSWILGPTGTAGTIGGLLAWLGLIALVAGLLWLGWAVLRWQNEEYVITTRRVIQAEGVFNKRASDSSLDKINDAQISVPFIGRLLGYGDLEVMTASESGIERFRLLTDPVAFKRAMLDAKRDLEYDIARPRVPAPPIRTDGGGPSLQRTDSGTPSPAAGAAAGASGSAVEIPARPATASGEDVTKTLSALADLRDRGAITPEEYEAKKRELLARL